MIKNILFDLDGTITDPGEGITNSVIHALKKYGMEIPKRHMLYKFIGPPLAESFAKHCGFSEEESYKAVEYYREYYSDKGIFENKVYEGVPQMLDNLKKEGFGIYLATSKPGFFADKILKHFQLDKFFDGVVGSELNGERVNKSEVIACVIERYAPSAPIMIGDRSYDIIGAKENGISSVGVLYGYGERSELAGADYVVESVDELKEILLGFKY